MCVSVYRSGEVQCVWGAAKSVVTQISLSLLGVLCSHRVNVSLVQFGDNCCPITKQGSAV